MARPRGLFSFPSPDVIPNAAELERMLRTLASRARRLSPPLNNDPERFHHERSQLARDLDVLANNLTNGTKPKHVWRAPDVRVSRTTAAAAAAV